MKILKLLAGVVLATTLCISGCKPKDADIKAAVEEKLKANPETTATMVAVNDGVATLSGELKDENAKAESEKIALTAKGVKTVVNNITVTPPPPPVVAAPPVIAPDDVLTSSVKDAVKDFPGVTATVADGVVTLTGEVSKENQRKIMMSISSLKPKKIDNKLTVK